MKIVLHRFLQNENGTFGVLIVNGNPVAATLEDAWKNNQKNISCIPAGTYHCTQHNGLHFQHVWQLLSVPNRDAILIHAGNTTKDTKGCILVGNGFGTINGVPGIVNSLTALNLLRSTLPNEFDLQIIDALWTDA